MTTPISAPRILIPLAISDSMLTSSTVAEPSASETAWVSAASYVAGDVRIRTQTHRKYMAKVAHSGVTTAPESDPTNWEDIAATDRWAMFDGASSTLTEAVASLTVVVKPGFFNALAFYKLKGATLSVTVKDAPGGSVVYSYSGSIDGPYIDEYDWCWGPARTNVKPFLTGILPYPNAEVTISVTASAGVTVGIGMAAIGTLRSLILGEWGGTEYGAEAEPVDYSLIDTDQFGNTTIVRRHSATNMNINVILPQADADYALFCLQEALATPCAVIATSAPGYAGLNVWGLVSGPVKYEGPTHARIKFLVKGLI